MIEHIFIHVNSDEMFEQKKNPFGYHGEDLEGFGAHQLNTYLRQYHPEAKVVSIESKYHEKEVHDMDKETGVSSWHTNAYLNLSVWLELKQ